MCVDSLNEIKALTRVESESEKKCVNAAVKTDNKKSHARNSNIDALKVKSIHNFLAALSNPDTRIDWGQPFVIHTAIGISCHDSTVLRPPPLFLTSGLVRPEVNKNRVLCRTGRKQHGQDPI